MFYFEVIVAARSKTGQDFFTYTHPRALPAGQIVLVSFRGRQQRGVIVKKSTKPSFQCLPIIEVVPFCLPRHIVSAILELVARYPYSSSEAARYFLPPSHKSYPPEAITHPSQAEPAELPPLNTEQQHIVEAIVSDRQNCMIFGDTGTGKTRMYMHILRALMNTGGNAILLEPEIGLATYIYEEVSKYLPGCRLYHSDLSLKQRQLLWQECLGSDAGLIIVGPRSALGLPLRNLQVIVLDEAHDQSYRQESQPYFHAQSISHALVSHSSNAIYVYGSATPNVTDYTFAQQLGVRVHRITRLAVSTKKSVSPLIISRHDTTSANSSSLLLPQAVDILRQTFRRNGQSLILINRRGSARLVRCESCSAELLCNACERMMVYHHDSHDVRCHYCGLREALPSACQQCGGGYAMMPFGTKAIQREVARLFPGVSAQRFDTDNSQEDALGSHMADIVSGRIQCLMGTQMIAKGLDLPKLQTLVVFADAGGGGFMGEERNFQLLYQVTGRAWRGHQDVTLIIQTEQTDSTILKHVLRRDYSSFANEELAAREAFGYPPYRHLAIIHISRRTMRSAQTAGERLQRKIELAYPDIQASPPIANIAERVRGQYHWHILLRCAKRQRLIECAKALGPACRFEIDPLTMP